MSSSNGNGKEGAAVPPQARGSWSSFLKVCHPHLRDLVGGAFLRMSSSVSIFTRPKHYRNP